MQVRLLARALADATAQHAPREWLAADALGGPLADLLDLAVETHHAHLERIEAGDLTGGLPVDFDRLAELQQAVVARTADFEPELRPGGWIYLGEVIALVTQLITDLSIPPGQLPATQSSASSRSMRTVAGRPSD